MQTNFPELADSRWAFKIQNSLMLNKTSGINFAEIVIDWAQSITISAKLIPEVLLSIKEF